MALATWARAHRRAAWTILILPTLLIAGLAARTPVDLSFAGLMDRSHPEVARYFEASRAWGLGGRVPVLLEADASSRAEPDMESRLDAAELDVLTAVRSLDTVRSARGRVPRAWLEAHQPWLVDAEVWTAWTEAVEHPQSEARRRALENKLDAAAELALDADGRRLVLVTLEDDPLEVDLDAQAFPSLVERVDAVLSDARHAGIRARFAGMPAIVEQDQATTLARIRWLTPLSLVLALALIVGVERRWRALLAIAAPMVLAATSTVALMGLCFGRITLMEALFGIIVFGLGVDFAVHLTLRAREAESAGASAVEATRVAFGHTGPGVVAGALTTAGAFAIAATAPEPTFVHLGLTGALGILLCLLAMLIALPAAWAASPPATSVGVEEGQPTVVHAFVASIARSAARRPWLHVGAALVVVATGVFGLTQLRYESDLRRIVNRDLDAVPAGEAIAEAFDINPTPWVVAVDSLEDARALQEQWSKAEGISRVESAARWLRSDRGEREAWLTAKRPQLDALAQQSEAARELVAPLLRASDSGTPDRATLPAGLRDQLLAPDGGWLVYAFADTPHMDAAVAAQERAALRAHAPEATSMAVLFEVLLGTERPWVPRVLATAGIFVLLLLCLDLRRVRWVVLALVPVTLGCIAGFGLLGLAGVSVNTVTALGAPLVIGLGVDDGIHVVHRLREDESAVDPARATTSVGRAIALTTATTCASFGTLVFSGHPGMLSMAWVMLVALPLCLLASISTLTAIASLMRANAAKA